MSCLKGQGTRKGKEGNREVGRGKSKNKGFNNRGGKVYRKGEYKNRTFGIGIRNAQITKSRKE